MLDLESRQRDSDKSAGTRDRRVRVVAVLFRRPDIRMRSSSMAKSFKDIEAVRTIVEGRTVFKREAGS